jgi:hypothetical protein
MAREGIGFKYLGVTINKALTRGLHVSDTINKAKAKGQDVWPLARSRHMELALSHFGRGNGRHHRAYSKD